MLGAQEHQSIPFDHLVRLLNPNRFSNRSPLFQVKLDLQNLPAQTDNIAIAIDPLLIDPHAAQLDLLLALTETATGMRGVWQYNTSLFKVSTIQKMSRQYITLLRAFVADPSDTLSALNALLDKEEDAWGQAQQRQMSQKRHLQFKQARSKPVTIITQGD